MIITSAGSAIPLPETCTTTTYNGFGSVPAGELMVNGNASIVSTGDGQVLRVTPANFNQAGSAFTTNKVTLLNDGSFSTAYSFRFTSQLNSGADGLVFTVQNVANNVGGTGGGIGYLGLSPSIGVEFDNWFNGESFVTDLNDNHAGIDVNGSVDSVVEGSLYGLGINLDLGQKQYAWVDYNGATNLLEVRVAASNVRPAAAFISYSVDLPDLLGGAGPDAEDAFIGFTSGTGSAAANHDVIDWSFSNCYRPAGEDSPPFVDAGGPYSGIEDEAAPVLGSASDDFGVASTAWTSSGPGTCLFDDPAAVSTNVTCDEPGSYTLTLTATDTAGQTASDTAAHEVANGNEPPAISSLTATATGACTVDAKVDFTDPDTGDTHTAAFGWGDGDSSAGTVTEANGSGSATGSHTYAAAGTYTIEATVTDQDGDSDSETLAYTTKNQAGAFLPPINANGTRSVFKKGSTIPIKIVITDCDGDLVTDLTPTVHLDKVDSNPDGSVNEPLITEVATNGKQMRWLDTFYHYTLSTKNSQFAAGGALAVGTWRISVTDPSLAAPASVVVDLR